MKNEKGFTLVELLAVIAILAILVIIALPNVINMYNKAQKETFLTEAKKVYSEAEKKYISSSITGNAIKTISSADNSKLDMTGEKLQYCVVLNSSGEVTDMKVSNGKWVASLKGKTIEDLTIDDLEDGNLDNYECGGKKSSSFENDSWKTIVETVKSGNDGNYKVGDTKEVDLGELGKHNVRIANKSTPSECSTEGFSQTACGFVLEFEDIVTERAIDSSNTNVGGFPATAMHTYLNTDLYNMLPPDLKSAIIDTIVISGHGKSDSNNFASTDKLYLLAPKELYNDSSNIYDSSKDLTRQLDYYNSINVTASNYSGAIKKFESTESFWWLRSINSRTGNSYHNVYDSGYFSNPSYPNSVYGVSPAFRIG